MNTRAARVVLGVDPGWRTVGYGVIRSDGTRSEHIACGCIHVHRYEGVQRLSYIFKGVSELVEKFTPEALAIEQVFLARNPVVALKLGQARGAAVAAAGQTPVAEYSARHIKLALTGVGTADKEQVSYMVQRLLGIRGEFPADATDALAAALCHAHSSVGQVAAHAPAQQQDAGGRG